MTSTTISSTINNDNEETSKWLDLSITDKKANAQEYVFYDPYKSGISTLENLVNTCFFNTVVQCLCHTNGFSRYILKHQYPTKNRLWRECTKLVKVMWHDNYRLSPKDMYTAFAMAFKKNNHNQEDFHEILSFILNHFHDALQYEIKFKDFNDNNDLVNQSIKTLNDSHTNMSIINDLFLGQLHQRIQCGSCGNISHTFPTFLDVVLRLEKTNNYQNIYNLFHSFCDKETLEGEEAYNCDHCHQKKVTAYKKTTFWRLPQYLIVVLGRFDWMGNKNCRMIDYPIMGLDISKHSTYPVKSNQIYDLYAVACHQGNTRGGHYYTVAKVNGQWTNLNDDRFHYITKLDNVVCQDAYVLFYKRNVQN